MRPAEHLPTRRLYRARIQLVADAVGEIECTWQSTTIPRLTRVHDLAPVRDLVLGPGRAHPLPHYADLDSQAGTRRRVSAKSSLKRWRGIDSST